MFDHRQWFVIPANPERGQLFINSVTLYAYNAEGVIHDDIFTIVLESFVNILSLWLEQVNTTELLVLDHFILAKKWGISAKRAHDIIHHTTHFCTLLIINWNKSYHIIWKVIHYLPTQCLGKAISVHRFLSLILVGHACSQWSWKVKSIKHYQSSLSGMGCHLQ